MLIVIQEISKNRFLAEVKDSPYLRGLQSFWVVPTRTQHRHPKVSSVWEQTERDQLHFEEKKKELREMPALQIVWEGKKWRKPSPLCQTAVKYCVCVLQSVRFSLFVAYRWWLGFRVHFWKEILSESTTKYEAVCLQEASSWCWFRRFTAL